jgi:ferric-dicitrate binding protein FerR (iron transport regulator)
MKESNPATSQVIEDAADWLIRLDDKTGPDCRAEFLVWLRQSASHPREFLLACDGFFVLDTLDAGHQIGVQPPLGKPPH